MMGELTVEKMVEFTALEYTRDRDKPHSVSDCKLILTQQTLQRDKLDLPVLP